MSKVQKNKQKPKKHIFLKIVVVILLIIAAIAGYITFKTVKNGGGLQGFLQVMTGQNEETLKNLEEFRVLILGVSKDISTELTDTIMVASYNPKTQKATLLSIPRDTYVGTSRLKATSYDKINAVYQKGPEKTLEKVNTITGLNIKYYVVIDNNALKDMVDAIGGVEFDVPIYMDYDDVTQDLHIHLKAGLQKLDGEKAEWVVRFRHNNNGTSYPAEYGDNDLGRMRTQREFIKALIEQTVQLKNVTKIGAIFDAVKENVETNIKDWSTVKDYIPYAVNFNTENLQTETLPGTTAKINDLWFFEYDQTETKELIDELFTNQNGEEESEEGNITIGVSLGKKNTTDNTNTSSKNTTNSTSNLSNQGSSTVESKKNIKIELLNGSSDSTVLTKLTTKLKNEGYNVYKTGTTNQTAKTTIINKKAVDSSITEDLKDILGVGTISSSYSGSSTVDVSIIIGKDYK